MAKVLQSLLITILMAVVYCYPLDDKPNGASNVPHTLLAHPPTQVHDNKPHGATPEINRPKRDEPQQPKQPQSNEPAGCCLFQYQGPTPKPVHHYRDAPIIQRRSAGDKSKSSEENTRSDEQKHQSPVFQRDNADKSSTEENSRSEEKKNPEIKSHQRRDTRDQDKEDDQSTPQKSNPSLLASNPNIQSPALKSTTEDQNVPHVLASNPSSQYGISTSTRVPDLIPASSTNLRSTDQTENVKDNQNHQLLGASGETTPAKVASDDQQQRKTRDVHEKSPVSSSHPLLSGQNDEATKPKSSTTNQEHVLSHPSQQSPSQNRKVRDVNENQPHLLASNPQTSLNNRDDPSSRSATTGISSSTTENTKISHIH